MYSYDRYKGRARGNSRLLQKLLKPFLIIATVALALNLLIRYLLLYPVTVTDESMRPSLEKGSTVYLLYPHLTAITRNDIVLVDLTYSEADLLCRITGIGGDVIAASDGRLTVSGRKAAGLTPTGATPVAAELLPRDHIERTEIRPGEFYCLKDNREFFNDSRVHSAFSEEQIKGVVFDTGILTGL